jgi:phage tail-like protein
VPVRGLIEGLPSPHPIGPTLPGLYQGEEFVQRFTGAFDESLAPVCSVLDNLDAYLDPHLTPPDFLGWLAGWVGVALDENWQSERQRTMVARTGTIYRHRGTVGGLAEQVAHFAGVEPEIVDNGGVRWSNVPGGRMPGRAEPSLIVRLEVSNPTSVDRDRLDALVAENKPANMPHTVEVSTP